MYKRVLLEKFPILQPPELIPNDRPAVWFGASLLPFRHKPTLPFSQGYIFNDNSVGKPLEALKVTT